MRGISRGERLRNIRSSPNAASLKGIDAAAIGIAISAAPAGIANRETKYANGRNAKTEAVRATILMDEDRTRWLAVERGNK